MPLAIVITGPGGPETMKAVDLPITEPGSGQARIRQSISGVNFVDIYIRSGLYPLPPGQSALGFEGAGVVDAIGPGVEELKVGDRVAYIGHPLGSYAEMRTLSASRLVKLPDGVSERVAGSTMLRGLTAHMLLQKVYPLKAGEWVLVHAGAGGVGQLVTRLAKRLGANVIATVGSEAKAGFAYEAGADTVLLHTAEDWVEETRRIADRRGVHLAIDGIGGAMLSQTLAAVRPFGMVASLGQAAGPIPPIEIEELTAPRAIGLSRPSVLTYANDPELYRQGTKALMEYLQAGLINPIGAEYELKDAARAHADLEAGRTTASVVLTM
ncbi:MULTISPECIES: quinone oxidoreductase [Rhizobium]|uniref:NADPH2:quinone reductase n=1 Tax=Rhizobium lusitanum TaxID=293958 RepID=A0A1C3W650_9HYPH|nr:MULTISPECIES: quinone oxidoreductase [Rhizobium]NKJ04947.1 NADPH2:quinone reductase [Rhizobium sp. SG741]NKJ36252.1 NADPH2:quinone reductase [Rhizobium sp. SG570]NRP84195.1 2-haloacrylate reductase [Ensifer adhaerens]SCB35376.1 NADPH2:quinone reductase [Rhizobium lusitanum]